MAKTSSASAKIIPTEGLTFDDLLLLPGFTNFKRREVDLTTMLHPTIKLTLPILASPMDTVTEDAMAIAIADAGGMGIIHRNLAPEKQAAIVKKVKTTKASDRSVAATDKAGHLLCGAAVGAGEDMEERVKLLMKAGADVICVDSGHGHSQFIIDIIHFIKKQSKSQVVMAGNVATFEGAAALIKAGADILRVGVGPGSICTTRVVTGMGVPQITAIMEAVRAAKGKKVSVVADGGIRQMGDMAKALGCGAHAVMLGGMLAGHTEAPGETIAVDGTTYKRYQGMGSVSAMKRGGAERYGQSKKTEEKKLIAEGVEGLVPAKGSVNDFLYQVGGALRSAFYYIGGKNFSEFHKHARFIRITNAGLKESHPHTINITSAGSSYMG